MTINRLLIVIYGLLVLLLCGLGFIAVSMLNNQNALNQAQETRYKSYLAGDELRQSSQDLTRLARTYVSTADSKYEDLYWDVIAIRSGEKVRPDGRKTPLNKIMEDLGFTEGEFAKLKQAANNSDGLIWTETVAMNAVKGKFHDANKEFTRTGPPDLELARKLMFNNEYHQFVVEIMAPIDDFFTMLNDRTQKIVDGYVQKSKRLLWWCLALIVALITICVVSYLVIFRKVNVPVAKLAFEVEKIGDGDLTREFEEYSNDEIGQLAKALKKMTYSLREMFQGISNGMEALTGSANELSGVADSMSQGTQETSSKANSVAASAEELSANMDSVAAASEQAATNVNLVAAATEEMTSTIQEITVNTTKSSTMTADAAAQSVNASEKVNELGTAAHEISKVTETITEISEQTNLLALNATIEAARAGEAGKGFAVVANEIKDLAKQTSEATQEIKDKIENVQQSTKTTVDEIGKVNEVIKGVNEMAIVVASAIEEQSATTQEIATNVNQASQGIQEVTENVSQSSMVSRQVAADIAEIDNASGSLQKSSVRVNKSADTLNDIAKDISSMIGRFKV
ncbi:MAG: methyl-accepting chemotaxis protein [Desulfobulbaceae bacterium]|nr:methyl-accepting chemotaxis protein [Desulfobulbaceae bacterium]